MKEKQKSGAGTRADNIERSAGAHEIISIDPASQTVSITPPAKAHALRNSTIRQRRGAASPTDPTEGTKTLHLRCEFVECQCRG